MSINTFPLNETDVLSRACDGLQESGLLKEEADILTFLQTQHSDLVPAYVLSILKGRQGILRRLAGSMLREDIMGLSSHSYDLYAIESIYTINVPAIDDYWQNILQALHVMGVKSGKVYKLYPLLGKECLVIPVTKTYAFNRMEVDDMILHITEKGIRTIDHAVELLELLREKEKAHHGKDSSDWIKLAVELINGSGNLALSYAYWDRKKKQIQEHAKQHGITNMIDWILLNKQENPEFDSSLFFEQLSIEGHNLHPGTKTKIGMAPEDVFRYAPEFDGRVDIQFVGIRKDFAEWSVLEENDKDANAFLFKEYPELKMAAEQELREKGLSDDDYVLVPVHSWQLEKAIPEIYHQEIDEQIVIPIHGIRIPCGATSSFRTVVPLMNGALRKHAIKVAVNSQMTSTVRSISANTTNNAPVISRLIRSIMQQEKKLLQTFVPIYEFAGFNFKTDDSKQNELKCRNLSSVFRENIEAFVGEDEVAIVGSSLFAESPISGKPIIMELIDKFAKENKEVSVQKAALQFVSEYASIALPGFLTLLVKYGIGLEGHLQNSVMVFKNGRPVRMLFRDWGGMRIFNDRLGQLKHVPFYPHSVTVTDQLKEVHNKVHYTVFQNHFGELILQVSKNYGLREGELWQEIYRHCEEVFHVLETIPQYKENVLLDRKAFYQEKVDHKALTKMRLKPNGKDYSFSIVPNPLYEFSRR